MRGAVVFHITRPRIGVPSWLHGIWKLPYFLNHYTIIYEESFLPKKLFAVSLRGSNSHWLL